MKFHIAIFIAIILALTLMLLNIDVVTLFKGSHVVTGLASNENDISCTSCHSKIALELQNSTIHSNFKCEECHRLQQTAEGKTIVLATHNETGVYVGEEAHAAYTPRCLDCHGSNGIYINDTGITKQAPPANPFNETDYGSDYSAHKPFVKQALDYDLSIGENEACLACHTNYSIEFEFKRPLYFDFYISENFYITINEIGQPNTTLILKRGDGSKHVFFRKSDNTECEDCHGDVWWPIKNPSPRGEAAYNASHIVVWKGGYLDGLHSPTTIGFGYTNISDYCLSACHNPLTKGTVPSKFTATVHVARRISCYDCHNNTWKHELDVWCKPHGRWDRPKWGGPHLDEGFEYHLGDVPLFLQGDTCFACKRKWEKPITIVSYTEPNHTVYLNGILY